MSFTNPFDLLGDDDNDDPSQLLAAQEQKIAARKPADAPQAPAKLPTKPLPPAQAVREARSNVAPAREGGGFGGGRFGQGRGRGGRGAGRGLTRDFRNGNADDFSGGYAGGGGGGGGEDGDAEKPQQRERGPYGGPRPPYRGGRRGGFVNGDVGGDSERPPRRVYEGGFVNGDVGRDSERPPRRVYERHSGTGRGLEMKRDGSGRGNWGTPTDDIIAQEPDEIVNKDDNDVAFEKQPESEAAASDINKDNKDGAENETEEEQQEDKEMTLLEYEKIKEEKRKALLALKTSERKVDADKAFESMKQLSLKKSNDEIFIKLGSGKEARKQKENADRDEKAKKSVSIAEFLKPAEGARYYSPRGRGRGRGRGDHGQYRGSEGNGFAGPLANKVVNIEFKDQRQFPTLGGK